MAQTDEVQNETSNVVVIGILSKSINVCLREAQRKILIPKARAYTPLVIKVFFLLDDPTPELEEENRINQDIVFLNKTSYGVPLKLAALIHIWLTYVLKNIPGVILIARMDDDAFLCVPQIFDRLNEVKHELLYYGYPTGKRVQCPSMDCVDEMFLVVGAELARRVVNRNLCIVKNEPDCLKDGNGGHYFRRWIQMYDDFVFINERKNGKIVWFYYHTPNMEEYARYKTPMFCQQHVLFHKASITDIYTMDNANRLLLNQTPLTDISDETLMKAENCSTYAN